jgi:hypothetical protein
MEVSGQVHAMATLSPGNISSGNHWIGGWVGPRTRLETVTKRKTPSTRQESNPGHLIVQTAASPYTFWAITTHGLVLNFLSSSYFTKTKAGRAP